MGIFNLFKPSQELKVLDLQAETKSAKNLYNASVFQFVNRFGVPLTTDLAELVEYHSSNSIIFTLMDWKAQKMGQIKPMLMKVTDKDSVKEFQKWNGKMMGFYEQKQLKELRKSAYQEIDLSSIGMESDLYKLKKLLKRPNEYMNFCELLQAYSNFMDGAGYSVIWGDRMKSGLNKGKSQNWYPLPSHLMRLVGGNTYKPVKGYALNNFFGATDREFLAEDSCHIKTFSMNYDRFGSQLYGTSKIQVAITDVLTFVAAKDREYYSFKTGDAAYILSPKEGAKMPDNLSTPTGIQKFKDTILRSLRQKDRHSAAIVNFALELLKLDSPLTKGVTLEAKKEIKQNIAGIWHLSHQYILGQNDGAKLSTSGIKDEIKSSLRDGVFPQVGQLFEALNDFEVEPNYKGYELVPDYDCYDELTEDIASQIQYLQAATFLSINEKRKWIEMDKLDNKLADIPEALWSKQNK